MRSLALAVLLGLAAGPGCDAGVREADKLECADDGGLGLINHLGDLRGDGMCVACELDAECQVEYQVGAPCQAFCRDGSCWRHCSGVCTYTPDAGGCAPATAACPPNYFTVTGTWLCDPACAPAGACRLCVFDSECQTELGPTGICQRHCGTCCHSDGFQRDAGIPCGCE